MAYDVIQRQLLGFEWLDVLIGRILIALGIATDSSFGGGIQFFLYDTLKITILLCGLIFVI